jgi:DNA-binding CsgD family transcriptional regulator
MTVNYPHLNISLPSPPLNSAVDRLSRIQTELISDALRRAVEDAGAAMKHQLGEPLTALLLYLDELKRAGQIETAGSGSAALSEIVDKALREIERVCDIVEQIGEAVEASVDTEAAIARGRGAIDSWTSNNRVRAWAAGPSVLRADVHPLTPREQEVLALITAGCSNKEGGHRLGISTRTFEAHRARLMGKLGARNAADLIRKTSNQNQ